VFGAAGSPYSPPGEINVNVSTRNLRSTDHYNGDVEQTQRQDQLTYVVNLQHAVDVSLSYQWTPRVSLTASVPFISASWSIPSPTSPTPGPRAVEAATGLGDISVATRAWMLNTKEHLAGNVGVGIGVKVPTGKADAMDTFADSRGQNIQARYVDQSAQPGDGGWGVSLEVQGFRRIKRASLFGSANYLLNPRNTNDTPSLTVSRLAPGQVPSASSYNKLVNSVPDQYLVRAGATVALGKGFGATLAWRAEGMPRYDIIGRSDGFRRPGVEMFLEPGISYSNGRQSFSVNIPAGYYRNRFLDPYTNLAGDATFPNYIVLAQYGFKLGGKKAPTAPGPLVCEPRDEQ
jgi:hypothetical protein